jgi:RimJ/RimL family protein N-acetyltransferase
MLETNRLLIRPFVVDDAPFILDLLNTPSWLAFIGDRGVRTLVDAQEYILNGPLKSYEQYGYGSYLVRIKDTSLSIGMCGLFKRESLEHPDIGFAFLPDYAGNGYGYESAAAVMAYARDELGLSVILGITKPTNGASIRLLQKLGLHLAEPPYISLNGEENLLFRTL